MFASWSTSNTRSTDGRSGRFRARAGRKPIEREPIQFARRPEEKKQEREARNNVAAEVEEGFAPEMAKGNDHQNATEGDKSFAAGAQDNLESFSPNDHCRR